jgi:hypothetical protein
VEKMRFKISSNSSHIVLRKSKFLEFDIFFLLENRGIQEVLRKVNPQDLRIAFKRLDPQIKEKIYENMSKRAAVMLQEDVQVLGPLRLIDVMESQKKIFEIIQHLVDNGEIAIHEEEKMIKDEFEKSYNAIIEKAMLWLNTARVEGLLALEEMIDKDKFRQREIMEYGISLVVDGTDPSTIDRILTNIINQETDGDLKKLKIIQKDAIFAIHENWHPRLMIMLLNSHVDIGIDRVMQEYLH